MSLELLLLGFVAVLMLTIFLAVRRMEALLQELVDQTSWKSKAEEREILERINGKVFCVHLELEKIHRTIGGLYELKSEEIRTRRTTR